VRDDFLEQLAKKNPTIARRVPGWWRYQSAKNPVEAVAWFLTETEALKKNPMMLTGLTSKGEPASPVSATHKRKRISQRCGAPEAEFSAGALLMANLQRPQGNARYYKLNLRTLCGLAPELIAVRLELAERWSI